MPFLSETPVRLDGGFASPEVLDFLDCEPKVEYLVNMAANAVLKRKVKSAMKRSRHVLGDLRPNRGMSMASAGTLPKKTWPWKRRIIYKAEVVRAANKEPKDNPRFVSPTKTESAMDLREDYCQRGDVENRIKELHDGMQIGRTSCSNFLATPSGCC